MKFQSIAKTWAPRLCLWLLFFSVSAHAQISSAGVFDNVLLKYQTAAAGWATYITGRASWLFWTLVVISMVWTFGLMAVRRAEIGEFFAEFIKFTVFTGFYWWLLKNGPAFSTSIYSSLREIGANASGLDNNLSPSGIVDIGFQIWDRVVDQSSLWKPMDSLVGLIIAAIILGVLALVGVNMLLLLISGWILAYSGIFFLGFGGSRWTSDIAIGYYKQVLNVAVQLMVMVLLVGIGKTFLDDYYAAMSVGVTLKEMAVMLVVCIILLALVNKVPAMVGSIAGGNTGHIGTAGAGGLLAAGGVAAAAVATGGAAIAGAATSAAGGASAIKAAFSKASENVANGSDVMSSMAGGGGGGSSGGSTAPGGASGGGGGGGAPGGAGGAAGSPFSAAAGLSSPPPQGSGAVADTAPAAGSPPAAGNAGGKTGAPARAAGTSGTPGGALAQAGGSGSAAAGGSPAVAVASASEGAAAAEAAGGPSSGEGASAESTPGGEGAGGGSDAGGASSAGSTAPGAPAAAPAPAAGRAARAAGAVARAAGTAGRIAVDAGANLAKGTGTVAKNKASEIADKARERIANTTGGKIAAAIRGETPAAPVDPMANLSEAVSKLNDHLARQAEPAPQFDGNTISAGEAEDEIAAFRDGKQGNEPTI